MSQEKLNGAVDRSLERAVGERKGSIGAQGAPGPELVERAGRRRFTAEYKLAIVREADGCTAAGEVGALLRREGLYASHLTQWRQARDAGALEALERPRGRKRTDPREGEVVAPSARRPSWQGRLSADNRTAAAHPPRRTHGGRLTCAATERADRRRCSGEAPAPSARDPGKLPHLPALVLVVAHVSATVRPHVASDSRADPKTSPARVGR